MELREILQYRYLISKPMLNKQPSKFQAIVAHIYNNQHFESENMTAVET